MKIILLGDIGIPAVDLAKGVIKDSGHTITDGTAHVAIAPFLTKKLSEEEIYATLFGTLIFHPSPLPYGRGASAIRWAYRRKEPITAATWFWANEHLDAGDICEQEIITIDYQLRPREFYQIHVLPAMERTLQRCLVNLSNGIVRKIKQDENYATTDPFLQ